MWNPMETAPKDGTVIEILSRNYGRASAGTTEYRARWLRGIWLNWDNLNEELCYAIRWRLPDDFDQPRQWTDAEEETLAGLHAKREDRFIPFEQFL